MLNQLSIPEGLQADIILKKASGRGYGKRSYSVVCDPWLGGPELADPLNVESVELEPQEVKFGILNVRLGGVGVTTPKWGQVYKFGPASAKMEEYVGRLERTVRLEPSRYAISDDDIHEQQHRDAFQKALIALQAAFYEDYEKRLDAESRAGLEYFMLHGIDVKVPLLSAESTGHIIATWRNDAGSLSLRFVGGDVMHFAMTISSPDGPVRTYGEARAFSFFSKNPQATRIVK